MIARRVMMALVAAVFLAAGLFTTPVDFPAPDPVLAQEMQFDRYPVDIHFDEENRKVGEKIREICDDELPGLAEQLGMNYTLPIEIRAEADVSVYRSELGNDLPTWGVAFAVMQRQLIVVDVPRATNAWNSLERVIPHELSHLLVAQVVPHTRFPIWFLEGLAQWQAGEWSMMDSWQLMNAIWSKDTPRIQTLVSSYPNHETHARTAYRLSYSAFTTLFEGRFDELPAFLARVKESGSFDVAFEELTGTTVPVWSAGFQEDIEERYHSRLMIFQTGPLFGIAAVLFLLVIVRYIVRKRRKMKELERLESGPFA